MSSKTVVFDLDDTLALEIDYLKSAFREIAHLADPQHPNLADVLIELYFQNENAFAWLCATYPQFTVSDLLHIYRNHSPNYPKNNCKSLLAQLKTKVYVLGLVTDGYSVTQRNKLKALGIDDYFDLLIISEEFGSEKPSAANFEVFHQFQTQQYYYVGDNVSKDFITPNALGWTTICLLDAGNNIHPQDFNKDSLYLPHKNIYKLEDLLELIVP